MNQFTTQIWAAIEDTIAATQAPQALATNSALAAEQSYRLSMPMPRLLRYEVDAVINRMAAIEQPSLCGKFCGRCEIFNAYTRRWEPIVPDCIKTVRLRERRLSYYSERLFKAMRNGYVQVWSNDCTESLEPPKSRPLDDRSVYRHCKPWMETSVFFLEDLVRFCDLERIRLEIFDPNQPDSPVMASAGLPREIFNSAVSKPQPSAMPNSGHDDSLMTASEEKKQRRFDLIGAELHEIMTATPSLTPTQVMKILMGRASDSNSCVVANDGDSVRWEDSRGRKVSLTQDKVNDRLRRWRILNNHIKAPDGKS